MPIIYTDPEMEILYDRLASYARVLKALYIEFKEHNDKDPYDEYAVGDLISTMNVLMQVEDITYDDIGIDSNVHSIRYFNPAKGA